MSRHAARIVELMLGSWLIASAFLWLHAPPQVTNALVVGLLTVATATAAFARPTARYLNVALALWLLASTWTLPVISEVTARNNIAVSIPLFIFALSGVSSAEHPTTRRS